MQLILASASPRRRQLLSDAGYKFTVTLSDFDENSTENDPIKLAMLLSKCKAQSVYQNTHLAQSFAVLGADTVVCIDGKILGKPKDRVQAKQMLKILSGRTHEVVTGYCIITSRGEVINDYCLTKVTFNKLADQLINDYVDSGYSDGKAGAYGIQDGFPLVEKYEGSYTNVIGLPTEKVFEALNKLIKQQKSHK